MSTEQHFDLSEEDREGLKKLGESKAGVQPLVFTRLEDSDFFWTQVAVEDDDLIFQMFPKGVEAESALWRKKLPAVLDVFAQKFFRAVFPQLQAAYVPEKDSWWFRANDCENILDKVGYAQRFITKLTAELRQEQPPRTST